MTAHSVTVSLGRAIALPQAGDAQCSDSPPWDCLNHMPPRCHQATSAVPTLENTSNSFYELQPLMLAHILGLICAWSVHPQPLLLCSVGFCAGPHLISGVREEVPLGYSQLCANHCVLAPVEGQSKANGLSSGGAAWQGCLHHTGRDLEGFSTRDNSLLDDWKRKKKSLYAARDVPP